MKIENNIARAVKIARKCIRIVYENIVFAIGVKMVCLLLGALGIAIDTTKGKYAFRFARISCFDFNAPQGHQLSNDRFGIIGVSKNRQLFHSAY